MELYASADASISTSLINRKTIPFCDYFFFWSCLQLGLMTKRSNSMQVCVCDCVAVSSVYPTLIVCSCQYLAQHSAWVCVSAGHFVMVTRRVTRTHANQTTVWFTTTHSARHSVVWCINYIFVLSLHILHRGWNECVLASAACSTDSSQPAICDTRPTRTLKSHC